MWYSGSFQKNVESLPNTICYLFITYSAMKLVICTVDIEIWVTLQAAKQQCKIKVTKRIYVSFLSTVHKALLHSKIKPA